MMSFSKTLCGRVDFACDPLHMELKACIQGVCTAIELGISHVVLESDAQQVGWGIQGDEYRLSMMGGLVHELWPRFLLSSM